MNHLPFVLRSYLDVPWTPATTRRTQVKMSSLRFGGDEGRMILQDLTVLPLYLVGGDFWNRGSIADYVYGSCQLLSRIGYEGKGYLTEELVPLALQSNDRRPLAPVWKFARPYRLDPGQKLSAQIIHRGVTLANGGHPQTPGIMFHGRRVKDGLPITLYDSKDTYLPAPSDDLGVAATLTRSTLNCPADSSVLIESVTSYTVWNQTICLNGSPAPLIQIFGPDGRPWVSSEVDSNNLFLGAATAAGTVWSRGEWANGRGWIDPQTDLIKLGEDRGWMLGYNQNFLLELENPDGALDLAFAYNDVGKPAYGYDLMVCVTLRGCLEVPNG